MTPERCWTKRNDETGPRVGSSPGLSPLWASPSWQLSMKPVPLTPYPNLLLGKGETPCASDPVRRTTLRAILPRAACFLMSQS